MSQLPPDGTIQVKPQSNVYTLLMIITILVLCVTTGLVLHKLMSPLVDGGYGMKFGELFSPVQTPK
ncbi:MAG: hypothetical protein QGG42_11855 [Phycisphaerae bacterium]|jgi:hypothetical protein|nr:hypothetical protein [Phycisphaerae bacterium]